MNIEITSIDDLRQLLGGERSHSIKIGQGYLIQTCTLYYTGRVIAVTDSDVVLEDAAWIPSIGRFMNTLATGLLDEVEPCPHNLKPLVPRAGIICMIPWSHDLPKAQK